MKQYLKYELVKDIVIPAGTLLTAPPVASTRWGKDYEAPVHLHNDLAGHISVDIKEALALGLVTVSAGRRGR